jgi:gluconolactonase
MPDIYTTNLCFGGPALKTAFVTLSTTGKRVSIDWPRAGTPLNLLNG